MAIQHISMRYYHFVWHKWLAMAIYSLYLIVFALIMLLHMNALAEKHGFLDGHARRDNIPDLRVTPTLVRNGYRLSFF